MFLYLFISLPSCLTQSLTSINKPRITATLLSPSPGWPRLNIPLHFNLKSPLQPSGGHQKEFPSPPHTNFVPSTRSTAVVAGQQAERNPDSSCARTVGSLERPAGPVAHWARSDEHRSLATRPPLAENFSIKHGKTIVILPLSIISSRLNYTRFKF